MTSVISHIVLECWLGRTFITFLEVLLSDEKNRLTSVFNSVESKFTLVVFLSIKGCGQTFMSSSPFNTNSIRNVGFFSFCFS